MCSTGLNDAVQVAPYTEQHLLVWESRLLVKLGHGVARALQYAGRSALQQGLQFTALGALVSGLCNLPLCIPFMHVPILHA